MATSSAATDYRPVQPVGVIRQHYPELHKVLSMSQPTLEALANKYYSVHYIDISIKSLIVESSSNVGARTLLDHLMLKIELCPDYLSSIISIMRFEVALKEVVYAMESTHRIGVSTLTVLNRDSILHDNDTSVSDTVSTIKEATKLKESFQCLTENVMLAIHATGGSTVALLKLRMQFFFQSQGINNSPEIRSMFLDLETTVMTADGVIRFMVNRNLIGYLNYMLLKNIFQNSFILDQAIVTKIDDYERQHEHFIRNNFRTLIAVFKSRPDLAPVSANCLPEIKVTLSEPWKNRSLYQWNELMADIGILPDHLMIKDIHMNCVTITYIVLPCFLSNIVKIITDVNVIKRFERLGLSFDIDSDLVKMAFFDAKHHEQVIKHATAIIEKSNSSPFLAIEEQCVRTISSCDKKIKLICIPQPAPATHPQGGYDDEMFLSPPPKDLQCILCLLTVREPRFMECCGAIMCEVCMSLSNASAICPHCRINNPLIVLDKRTRGQTMSLKVKCINGDKSDNCNWTGELVDYLKHIKEKCPYRIIQCQYGCGQYFMASDIKTHEEEECTQRPYYVIMSHQRKVIESLEENHAMEKNEQEEKYTIALETQMRELEEKRVTEVLGLEKKRKKEILALETHLKTTEENEAMQEMIIDKQRKEIKDQKEEFEKCRVIKTKKELTISKMITYVLLFFLVSVVAIDISFNYCKTEPSWIGPNLTPNDWYTLTNLKGVPPCVRVLTNFTQYDLTGEWWYSPPFYTRPGGYKLQLMVDFFGSFEDKDDVYIRIALYLMKGDNDDGLRWPFNGSVTVRLLNWKEDKNHLDHTFNISTIPDIESIESLDRVREFFKIQLMIDKSDFIDHSKLLDNGVTQYLMNDVMNFMILEATTTGYEPSVIPVWCHQELSSLQYGILPVYRTIELFNKSREYNYALVPSKPHLYTDPFYTSNGGYEVQLGVHPNGIFDDDEAHVRVSIHVLKGPFPIIGIFVVQLLNWKENKYIKETSIAFDVGTTMLHEEEVIERGSQLISHNDLTSGDTDAQYVYQDMMSFRISFEPIIQEGTPTVPSWYREKSATSVTPSCTMSYRTVTLYSYSAYKKTNSKWWSPQFYSSDGDTFQLKIHSNGHLSGEGTHLSLYVYLVERKYDYVFSWPAKLNDTITVQILNWSSDSHHVEETIDLYKYHQRVVDETTAHKGWGYPEFISHSKLEDTSDPTRFIKNDNICIRILNDLCFKNDFI